MAYTLNNREVEVLEVESEVGEGISVIDAVFSETNKHLSEDELLDLETKYQAELYEDWYSSMASAVYDMYKDS